MKYLVVSTAVTDELCLPDGTQERQVSGGAGIYALSGIKVWTNDVEIVTGVGGDYFSLHGAWYSSNHLSTSGLIVKGEFTPRTTIQYFENGEREEIPVYGLDHYRMMEPAPEDVERHCKQTKGVYIFKNANAGFWEKILRLKDVYGFKLLWEIAADAAIPEEMNAISAIAKQVDIFSINLQEAFHLLSARRLEEAVPKLGELDFPLVFLRMGEKGAYIIDTDKVVQIPALHFGKVVDPTGGGNSSSGAVLYGYCEGKDPLMAGIMGSISAAYSIAQYGPPPYFDPQMRASANQIANRLYDKLQGTAYEIK